MPDFPPLLPDTIANVLTDHDLTRHPLSIIPLMNDAHIPDLETLSYGAAFALAQIPNIDWARISAGFPRIIADLLSDHNLANHPLTIIPTMDAAHIPNLDVAKITSGRFGMARMPDGTATYILTAQGAGSDPAYAAPPAADVGGLYGINVETLGANKTLTVDTDEIYQWLNPTFNRIITLSTVGAVAGDRWVIKNNAIYSVGYYLKIQQNGTDLDRAYASAIKVFIFDGSNWVGGGIGTGEAADNKRRLLAIGYQASAKTDGVALGHEAGAYDDGVAVGWRASGYNNGSAVGMNARAYNWGVAVGASAIGIDYGIAIGKSSETTNKYYSIAMGYYSKAYRTAETAINVDGDVNRENMVVQGRWSGETSDGVATEIFLGGRANERFVLRAKTALAFTGLVVAQTEATVGTPNVTSSWEVKGLIKRDADGNTTLVGSTQAVLNQDGGAAAWVAAFSADDGNEALILTVTGAAATTIRWVARIDAVEQIWI